ncbi:MAG: antitoxin [Pseudanabaena sp.]|jgi:antitoxin VapB|nr:AbrB/MazE/SpoVT family DNA-binding domain-containing protein [Pseudanabaena sp. M090S1SP2A07QC]MCA6504883.1 AbrB/MazE/SpoVT family DNA-binding domain-containing protein [Pseudanabaena sp. M172S2SP2A07QC]MCA6510036.1 AbrB/MazE/SpoVT family DNA-binding domain-containing protein [Pseudanabaena sp. M109S1SP2A07QC]MCA6519946.1 AbrB/MazE/SpoVT family DNA-binding domain-containing protein [Pseudanabaena sp. M110S1SP2A07QC]MCA6524047.1 AbrB/MazE/SpoVT family DNA-binding domain-containing protein [Ps
MISQYQVRLFHNGRNQTLNIPHAFEISSNDVVIRKEGEKLIIEPFKKKSLLELLATLPDIDEDFPDIDEGLMPLDDIRF